MTKILNNTDISGYEYTAPAKACAHDYLLPALRRAFTDFKIVPCRAFDLGCGNGSVANWLNEGGFTVTGVDPSITGIEIANQAFPNLDLRVGSAYDPLWKSHGKFPLIVSLEVVEHLYAPRDYARCVRDLLEPNGLAIISTPYHGYLKNLALALAGAMDSHFTALWDHGHIKFWSPKTLTELFREAGLFVERVYRVGRIPWLAKSMILVIKKVDDKLPADN